MFPRICNNIEIKFDAIEEDDQRKLIRNV